ncbi:MAG: glycosyltransferase [Acidobacteriaceae bacterium]
MKYLVSRTFMFRDMRPWGADVLLQDETGYVDRRVAKLPKVFRKLGQPWYEFQFAVRTIWRSCGFDAIAVGRYGYWVSPLASWLRLRKPVVLIDTEWRRATGLLDRLVSKHAAAVVCNTHEEALRCAAATGLPREKFRVVLMPYVETEECKVEDRGFIFAGGSQSRDFQTLFRAIEGLPYKVKVLTPIKFAIVPINVELYSTASDEYHRTMAQASCVVVPLVPESMRITGTTTWISAMGLGKAVVVTEPNGAQDYMEQGISGYICDYGDAECIRARIVALMENPELRARMGEAAKRRAFEEFSPEVYRRSIVDLLDRLTKRN